MSNILYPKWSCYDCQHDVWMALNFSFVQNTWVRGAASVIGDLVLAWNTTQIRTIISWRLVRATLHIAQRAWLMSSFGPSAALIREHTSSRARGRWTHNTTRFWENGAKNSTVPRRDALPAKQWWFDNELLLTDGKLQHVCGADYIFWPLAKLCYMVWSSETTVTAPDRNICCIVWNSSLQ